MKLNLIKLIKIPLLVLSIGFLIYGIQYDPSISINNSNEAFAANEYHIPIFKNADVSVSSNTQLKNQNTHEHKDIFIPTEINSKTLREVKALHIEKILNEFNEISSLKESKNNSDNDIKKIIKEIKKNILDGKDYGALQNLSELKLLLENSENKKYLSKILDRVDSIDQAINDKNKPIKDKKYLQNPKKQHKSNIPIDLLECKSNLTVIVKEKTGEPACVKKSTIPKLIERGWGFEFWLK